MIKKDIQICDFCGDGRIKFIFYNGLCPLCLNKKTKWFVIDMLVKFDNKYKTKIQRIETISEFEFNYFINLSKVKRDEYIVNLLLELVSDEELDLFELFNYDIFINWQEIKD